jgi:ferric-dicitrate binding protein FerR (iron transport regulator)
MPPISDHHQYLFLGKLTNSLSPEEDQELTALFAGDAAAVKAYEDLLGQLPAEQVAGSFRHLNAPGFWKDIAGEVHDQQQLSNRSKIRKTSVIVALTAMVALSVWWLLPGRRNAAVNFAVAATPPGSIELKLADGTTVDLSKVKGNLHKDQLILDNKDSSLSYQPAGESSAGAAGESPVGLNTISVPVAMDYKLNLPDGSEIWLNSASTVSFPTRFAADKREISITGEAYCRIARHPGQPFTIHLPGNTVQVTGTEFNVNTYDKAVVKVALVEGGANLVSGAAILKLSPGYQGISDNGGSPTDRSRITQEPFDPRKVLSWRQGIFYFDGAGLDELSPVLARWFGIRTQLDEPSLANKKFVGALYKHRSLNSFLDNLKAISHINSYSDNHGVLHFTAAQ